MMKKIFYFSLMFAAAYGFTSCKNEEDDIFEATAAERLNAASALYSARLTAQPNGWAMQYYPTYDNEDPNGAGYLLLCRFNKDYTVDVSGYNWPHWESVFNVESRDYEMKVYYNKQYITDTSYWEVITDNGPVLSFNSYNDALHLFSDPDYYETGTGFGGDYEFVVVDAPEDASYMMLKGKKRGTYNLLTPVEEGVDYETYLREVSEFQDKYFTSQSPVGCYIVFGDSLYIMEDANAGLPSIYPEGSDKIASQTFHPFLITKRGNDFYLRFRDAFERDDMDGVLQDLRFIPEEDRFVCPANNNFRIEPHNANQFFWETFEMGHLYTLKRDVPEEETSEKMRDAFATALKDMKTVNKNFVFDELRFRMGDEEGLAEWAFKYQSTSSAREVVFVYDMVAEPDGFKMTFKEAKTDNGANILNRVNGVKDIITNLFSQDFKVKGYGTQFNLSKVKFVSESDPDLWFVLQY